tara:strand:- start:5647 stop:6183 length:537 start_codon:yes stop_codon:yes gene_type:complete
MLGARFVLYKIFKMYDIKWDSVGTLRGDYIRKFFLLPNFWVEAQTNIGHNLKWKKYKFTRKNISKIPKSKGVYCFVLQPHVKNFFETRYLFYIGQTQRTLNIRFKEYLDELDGKRKSRAKIKSILDKYYDRLFFYYVVINSNSVIDEVEDNLIDKFIPQANVKVRRATINPEFQYLYE